jgi:hypothetical protein
LALMVIAGARRCDARMPGVPPAPCADLEAALGAPAPAAAARFPGCGSSLALPILAVGEEPSLWLAQRSIDRAWGPSVEESVYVDLEAPGWKSPGLAVGLSGLVPGAGQFYVGERTGWIFAALEVAGWVSYAVFRNRGDDRVAAAESYAGVPTDSTSQWAFQRFQATTGQSTAELEAVYAADPEAFYDMIGRDDRLLTGWSGNSNQTRDTYWTQRQDGELQLKHARITGQLLWLNHVVSAFDAFRAARVHNIPLERNLELELKTGWKGGGPALALTLQRKF